MQRVLSYFRQEPEKVFFLIRAVLATAIAAGVSINVDTWEPVLAVLATFLGVDYAATKSTHSRVYGADEAQELVQLSAQAKAVPKPLWDFVESTVKRLLPATEVPFAMAHMAGDLVAFFDRQLDAGTRSEILTFVHKKLRELGYLKVRDFPAKSVTSIVLLVFVLGACAPVANYVLGDAAQLRFEETGIMFVPGAEPAYEVLVDIQGNDVVYLADDGLCEATDVGLRCTQDEVLEPWLIEITGLEVSAMARYARVMDGRLFTVLAD